MNAGNAIPQLEVFDAGLFALELGDQQTRVVLVVVRLIDGTGEIVEVPEFSGFHDLRNGAGYVCPRTPAVEVGLVVAPERGRENSFGVGECQKRKFPLRRWLPCSQG